MRIYTVEAKDIVQEVRDMLSNRWTCSVTVSENDRRNMVVIVYFSENRDGETSELLNVDDIISKLTEDQILSITNCFDGNSARYHIKMNHVEETFYTTFTWEEKPRTYIIVKDGYY